MADPKSAPGRIPGFSAVFPHAEQRPHRPAAAASSRTTTGCTPGKNTWIWWATGLQKLLVIPAKTPPHKLAPELAAEQLRLQMCALAFADLPQAQVSDLENLPAGQKANTIDTVYKAAAALSAGTAVSAGGQRHVF